MAGVFVGVALVLILGDGNMFDVGGGVVVIDYWCLCFFGCSCTLIFSASSMVVFIDVTVCGMLER